mmetsp:Transcript_42847/g.87602  ORF Transcript_42847/g.87602 Transcript_42847/m.87602 type:complete len:229 (+) Transcript_42847:1186-1872(+)
MPPGDSQDRCLAQQLLALVSSVFHLPAPQLRVLEPPVTSPVDRPLRLEAHCTKAEILQLVDARMLKYPGRSPPALLRQVHHSILGFLPVLRQAGQPPACQRRKHVLAPWVRQNRQLCCYRQLLLLEVLAMPTQSPLMKPRWSCSFQPFANPQRSTNDSFVSKEALLQEQTLAIHPLPLDPQNFLSLIQRRRLHHYSDSQETSTLFRPHPHRRSGSHSSQACPLLRECH